jgi:hypothetical protein
MTKVMPKLMEYKENGLVNFMVGSCLGFIIWSLSSVVTGEIEPWDAQGKALYYYPLALFFSGVFGGALCPKNYKITVFGIYLGQLLYMILFIRVGPLVAVGIIVLAFYTLLAFLGGLMATK